MKEFLLSALPTSILAVDITNAGRAAHFYPNHQFANWEEAQKFFLGLGAAKDDLDIAFQALSENGIAKLSF